MGDLKTFDLGRLETSHVELECDLLNCQKQIDDNESKLSRLESSTDLNNNQIDTNLIQDAAYLKEKILLLRQKEVELRREKFQLNQIRMGYVERFQGKCVWFCRHFVSSRCFIYVVS